MECNVLVLKYIQLIYQRFNMTVLTVVPKVVPNDIVESMYLS